MTIAFYISSLVAILASLRVITNTNPVHALLFMVISLMAISMIFFSLGAPFAGALEVIVYAGAIMILFVFAVMMLNLGEETIHQEKDLLSPRIWIGPGILATILIAQLGWVFWSDGENALLANAWLGTETVSAKKVGIALFGPYLLAVELASFMLLAALVAAAHLGRKEDKKE